MRTLLIFLLAGSCYSLLAQVSYDFGTVVPPGGQVVTTVSQNYFGSYSNADSPLKYEFSEEGIFIVSINVNSISRKTIRESSQYTVRNNHIFGVTEDSIPCLLEGENYYFGIRNRQQIAGAGSANKLVQLSTGTYVLNYEENGKFVPAYLTFSANGLSIQQFDYDSDTRAFRKIKERNSQVKAIEFVTLYPTAEEWQKLRQEDFLSTPVLYKR